jgi:hypothetical protein
MMNRRSFVIFALVAVIGSFAITRGLVGAPGYTDAYYHFNAAVRLAQGQGFTETYLWTYIGAPETLLENGIAPSHLYWMPMTSVLAALGMQILNAPGDYGAAQIPFTLMVALTACIGYWLGRKIGGTDRHAWIAGLLTLFSGFFARFWGTIDTFAPYTLFGALCLVVMGIAADHVGAKRASPLQRHFFVWWILAGALAGLAHLTRADGLLLLLVGYIVLFWAGWKDRIWRHALVYMALMTVAYLVVMLPWFARILAELGTPLPLGGAQAAWFTQYDDLFSYPAEASPQSLFSLGLGGVLRTRWEAFAGPQGLFAGNLGTFVAVEGMVVMTPLMLIGLWRCRHWDFLRPFWLYALGLHLVMTLVFPFPGYRGGLLHSAVALVPFWAALGVAGLDDVVDWIAHRRQHWNVGQAKWVFSSALLALGIFLSLSVGLRSRVVPSDTIPGLYAELLARLPDDTRMMINDPAMLYYYTGMGGVATPNSDPDLIQEIARRYHVDYLLLEEGGIPGKLLPALENPPSFLTPLEFNYGSARLYGIRH